MGYVKGSINETEDRLSAIDLPIQIINLELVEYERELKKLNGEIDKIANQK